MSKRPHPEADRVEVEWVDSSSYSGWRSHKSVMKARKKAIRCLSVGLLLANDKLGVTLAGSAHAREVAGTMTIPRGAVVRMRKLWKAKR